MENVAIKSKENNLILFKLVWKKNCQSMEYTSHLLFHAIRLTDFFNILYTKKKRNLFPKFTLDIRYSELVNSSNGIVNNDPNLLRV